MMPPFFVLLRQEVRLAWAQGGGAGLAISFYAAAVALFPLGISPDPVRLAPIAGGVLWIAALLAALLSLDRMFQADHEDGTLEGLMLGPLTLPLIVLAKALGHWLSTLLPLVLLAPLFAAMLRLPEAMLPGLVLALLVGTPALSFIGAVAGALTVAVRRGGALVALLVLPLYIPVLIFGVAASGSTEGIAAMPASLSMLGGLTLASIALAPWAAAAALRIATE